MTGRYSSTLLSEHWFVYPLGNATPHGGRGKRFAITDYEGVHRCHREAVAAGHHPYVERVTRYQSPAARTPQRYSTRIHLTRVVDGWSELPGNWYDPNGWQVIRRIDVTLASTLLQRDGVDPERARLRVSNVIQLRHMDMAEVVVTVGDGDRHSCTCVLDDGTVLTHEDEQVRDQVCVLIDERLRWNRDEWNEATMVEDLRNTRHAQVAP